MPYDSISELPENVKNVLPKEAQKIYQSAFNNAFNEYKSKSDRDNPDDSREEVAHKVAWAAVKKVYTKDEKSGKWIKSN